MCKEVECEVCEDILDVDEDGNALVDCRYGGCPFGLPQNEGDALPLNFSLETYDE